MDRFFLLFALGLVGITLGLDLLGESQHNSSVTYSILVVGILLLVTYCGYAKNNENAILPLSLFRTRTFRLGIIANIFIRLSASGVPFFIAFDVPIIFRLQC